VIKMKFININIFVLLLLTSLFFTSLSAIDNTTNYLNIAKNFFDNGDYKKAIEFSNKAMLNDSSLIFNALNLRGISYYHLKDFKSSLADFMNTIQLIDIEINKISSFDKRKSELNQLVQLKTNTYFNRALVYQELNKLENALSDYTYVIANDINNKFALFNKGFLLYQLGYKDSAIVYFTEVLKLDSKDNDARYNRANIYYEMQNCDSAMIDYNELLKYKNNDEFIFLNIANCYYNQKNYNAAIINYTKSIKINNSITAAYYNRAQTYKAIAQYEEALKDLYSAMKIIDKDSTFIDKKDNIIQEIDILKKQKKTK